MAKNRLIMLLLLPLVIMLAGCDSTQGLQDQVSKLNQQNQALHQQIDALTAKTQQFQNAASMYQGCMAGWGILSNLCPDNIMTEGKAAIDAGFSGGGWEYWGMLIAKLAAAFISAGVAMLVCIRLAMSWLYPARQKLQEAKETIEEAESRARQARSNELDAKASLEQTQQKIRNAQHALESLQAKIEESLEEIEQINREIQEKKQDLNALGGFL